MMMTDEMVELVGSDDKVITAVLAHELGHVRHCHCHGLRRLVQATLMADVISVALGDSSTQLAGLPLLLGQANYSRDTEKEADREAVQILKAAGISPEVMMTLFEKLDGKQKPTDKNKKDQSTAAGSSSWLGIAFASHPTDAERMTYFRQAAREIKETP